MQRCICISVRSSVMASVFVNPEGKVCPKYIAGLLATWTCKAFYKLRKAATQSGLEILYVKVSTVMFLEFGRGSADVAY